MNFVKPNPVLLSASCARYFLIALFILAGFFNTTFCQEVQISEDSVKIRHHSPKKAILFSALVPGLGQIYNDKIWKVPIIYGGGGAALYFHNYFQVRYKKVVSYLRNYDDGQSQDEFEVYGIPVNGYNLERARDYYRKWRDYNMLYISGIYVLNVIDALVDAHFFEFDISDDLSLDIQPACITPNIYAAGVGIQLSMRF